MFKVVAASACAWDPIAGVNKRNGDGVSSGRSQDAVADHKCVVDIRELRIAHQNYNEVKR
jgi:hypothetical protein